MLDWVWDFSCLTESTALETGGVGFERCGHFPDATELHYGKCRDQCFWSLAHTSDRTSGYFSLCCFNFLALLFKSVIFIPQLNEGPMLNRWSNPLIFFISFLNFLAKVDWHLKIPSRHVLNHNNTLLWIIIGVWYDFSTKKFNYLKLKILYKMTYTETFPSSDEFENSLLVSDCRIFILHSEATTPGGK